MHNQAEPIALDGADLARVTGGGWAGNVWNWVRNMGGRLKGGGGGGGGVGGIGVNWQSNDNNRGATSNSNSTTVGDNSPIVSGGK